MRKFGYLILAALFAFNFATSAQNANRSGDRQNRSNTPREQLTAQDRADRMAKELDLSAEQKTKVAEFFKKQDSIRDARRAENRNTQPNRNVTQEQREKMRAEFEEMRKANDAELEAIVGKEKMEKYVKLRSERTPQGRENRGNR